MNFKTPSMKTLALTTMLVFIFLTPFTMRAQELEVTPGTMMFNVNPGSSQTQQVYVRNKGNKPQNFVFNLADWLVDESGETKYFAQGTTARSCADWITVSPALVTLQPNESANINVTMLVPNDESSTRWAVLFVQSAEETTGAQAIDKEVQMGLQVAARIAIPIYQSPSSNKLFKGVIEGLEEKIDGVGLRNYRTQVINTGDKLLNCKVYFTFSNLQTAEEFISEPFNFMLLPESSKTISYMLEKELEKGKYAVSAVLDYGYNEELDGVQIEIDIE
jgi:P pilus assembly chaperone PapD